MLSETDKAYIAGIIDGEGCITINASSTRAGTKSYTLRLMIAQADYEFLEYIMHKLGVGKIQQNTRMPHIYFLQICGSQAELALRQVYDYLIIKKAQADIAFQFRMTKTKTGGDYSHAGRHGGGKLPKPLQDLRKHYADELKRLKTPKGKDRPMPIPEPELATLIQTQVMLPGLN